MTTRSHLAIYNCNPLEPKNGAWEEGIQDLDIHHFELPHSMSLFSGSNLPNPRLGKGLSSFSGMTCLQEVLGFLNALIS